MIMSTRRLCKQLVRDEGGVTMIEYALLAALIAMAAAVVVGVMGESLLTLYTEICNKVTKAATGQASC